jgi:ABC-2 type transport system ATP-binding protein
MILELKNLYKRYHHRIVLDHIDWQIDAPQTVALVAPNGTGKTTLLNTIANLETRDAGSVKIFDLANTDEQIYQKMTFMQDSSVLFSDMTGKSHLQLIAKSYHLTLTRVSQVIDQTGIGNYLDKTVSQYSMGMKQLLLFAMAILPNPKLLLLDEPLNGLDPKAIVMLRETLQGMGANGTTILFSSHNLDEIDRLTNHVVFLHQGKLIPANEDGKRRYTLVMQNAFQTLRTSKWQAAHIELITDNKVSLEATATEITQMKSEFSTTPTPILDVVMTHQSTENQYFKLFGKNEIH